MPVSHLRMFLFPDLDISRRREQMSPVPGFRSVAVVVELDDKEGHVWFPLRLSFSPSCILGRSDVLFGRLLLLSVLLLFSANNAVTHI